MTIRPKKSLGQHFLRDGGVVKRILDSLDAGRDDRVVEIGPGTGALTVSLTEKYPDLHAYEVDSRAADLIEETCPQVTVHRKSFLDADVSLMREGISGKLVIVGNLPYFLTSPILFHIIDQGDACAQGVFMIQKEVAQRLVARPRTREYGILSVQAQVLGRIALLFSVSRHAFHPPPNVESAVISWRPGNDRFPRSVADLPVSLATFKTVVRTAFQQRRKKLSNAMKPVFGSGFPDGFDGGRRAEELEPDEFVDLAVLLEKHQGLR